MKRGSYRLLAEKYQTINETVADEFDSILQDAGFPNKKDYETAEVLNLIHDYLSKFDPRDLNAMVYGQIRMALGWNDIDTGLLDDYLQDRAGFSDPDPRDPQTGDESVMTEDSDSIMKGEPYKLLAEKYQTLAREFQQGVADEFDSILHNAGFPKEDYETSEVLNLINDYLKTFDNRQIDRHVTSQLMKAMEWNGINPDILTDYHNELNDVEIEIENQTDQNLDDRTLNAVKKYINDVNSIEIQTHYGNMVLPVVEIWKENGVLKISVDTSKEQ